MKLLITGASGTIAKSIIKDLSHDHTIRLASRSPSDVAKLFPEFECVSIDKLEDCVKGMDGIIHLAARNNHVEGSEEDFTRDNVELTKQLAEAASQAKVGHFIFASSLRALKPRDLDYYGKSKRDAEEVLAKMQGLKISIIRLAAVDTGGFRGKAEKLNLLPGFLHSLAQSILATLRPTASRTTVLETLKSVLKSGEATSLIVSDCQKNNKLYAISKRLMDIFGSIVLLLFTFWLLPLIAIAIRQDDGKKAVFTQERIGKNKACFLLFKFRTMKIDTSNLGTHEVSTSNITSVGRFLRRTKLDELPQVINILKGELSFVGPRPGLPTQTDLAREREQRGIYDLVPGLTGLAQIEGIDMEDPVRLSDKDLEYYAQRSLLLDLKIIGLTALKILKK